MSAARKRREQADARAAEVDAAGASPRALTRLEWAILIVTLALWLSCSVFLTTVIPPGDAPDEEAHLAFIEHLAQTWTLVDFRAEGRGTEMHQPPLYYAVCAVLMNMAGAGVYGLRLISTLCGLGLIAATFALARAWFPQREFGFHWACAVVLAFIPMNLYVCSAVNNDPLVNLLVVLGLLQMWTSRDSKRPVLSAAITGAIAGLAMLTKSTALAFVAVCLVWFGVLLIRDRGTGQAGKRLWAFLAAFAILWGPWAVRNTIVYGDPIAAGAFATVAAGPPPTHVGYPTMTYWLRWVGRVCWFTLWGAYDHLIHEDDFMPLVWYLALLLPVGLALVGFVIRWRTSEIDARRSLLLQSLAAGAAVLLAGFISFNTKVFQAQARYFFCYLPVFAILICTGLQGLGKFKGRATFVALLSLLAIGCWTGVAWRMWYVGH